MARLRRVSDNLGLAVALNGLATLDQDKVVVVCTIAQGCHDSEFEPGAIADELPDDVEVVVVPPHLTPALRKQIGGDLAVSHGAARVYPIRTQDAHYIAMNYLPGQRSAVEQRRLIVAEATKAWKTANPSQDVSTRFAPSSAPAPPPEARPAPKIPRDPIPSSQGATLLDAAEVRRFAEHLLSPARTKPAVLIARLGVRRPWLTRRTLRKNSKGWRRSTRSPPAPHPGHSLTRWRRIQAWRSMVGRSGPILRVPNGPGTRGAHRYGSSFQSTMLRGRRSS